METTGPIPETIPETGGVTQQVSAAPAAVTTAEPPASEPAPMSEHKRKFTNELMQIEETLRKIPSKEKYEEMIVALRLKHDMDAGRLAIDSKGLGKQLDAMGIDRSRFYDWNRRFIFVDWVIGRCIMERKETKEEMQNLDNLRRFVHADELFEVVEKVHKDSHKRSHKHNGIRRTYLGVQERYSNVTRTVCDIFCAHCEQCLTHGRERKPRPVYEPKVKAAPAPRKPRSAAGGAAAGGAAAGEGEGGPGRRGRGGAGAGNRASKKRKGADDAAVAGQQNGDSMSGSVGAGGGFDAMMGGGGAAAAAAAAMGQGGPMGTAAMGMNGMSAMSIMHQGQQRGAGMGMPMGVGNMGMPGSVGAAGMPGMGLGAMGINMSQFEAQQMQAQQHAQMQQHMQAQLQQQQAHQAQMLQAQGQQGQVQGALETVRIAAKMAATENASDSSDDE